MKYFLIVLAGISLSTGIYMRNQNLYGNPILTGDGRTINDEFTVPILISNLLRNSSVHLATPVPKINDRISDKITTLLGPEADNPASTFPGSEFEIHFYLSDDDAGNFFHFFLLLAAILVLPWRKPGKDQITLVYMGSLLAAILLFSAFFKWQPWGGRLQTPVFLLAAPFSAALFEINSDRKQLAWLQTSTVIFLILYSMPFLLMNTIRPLLPVFETDEVFYKTKFRRTITYRVINFAEDRPVFKEYGSSFFSLFYEGRSVLHTRRKELYFLSNFDIYYNYLEALKIVRDSEETDIGLIMDSNDWEYPIWKLLNRHAVRKDPVISHILVENETAKLRSNSLEYQEIIISTSSRHQDLINSGQYQYLYESSSIQVLTRE